jgi:hypothetical protein
MRGAISIRIGEIVRRQLETENHAAAAVNNGCTGRTTAAACESNFATSFLAPLADRRREPNDTGARVMATLPDGQDDEQRKC